MGSSDKKIIGVGSFPSPAEMITHRLRQIAKPIDPQKKFSDRKKKAFTKEEKELFDSCNKLVSATLIKTMNALEIPRYIEFQAEAEGDIFHVRIIRLPRDKNDSENSESEASETSDD